MRRIWGIVLVLSAVISVLAFAEHPNENAVFIIGNAVVLASWALIYLFQQKQKVVATETRLQIFSGSQKWCELNVSDIVRISRGYKSATLFFANGSLTFRFSDYDYTSVKLLKSL